MAKTTTKRSTRASTRGSTKSRRKTSDSSESNRPSETVKDRTSSMSAVPIRLRLEIDKALVREEPPLDTTLAVYEHFELAAKHHVTYEDFRRHATSVREVHRLGYADRLACELLRDASSTDREAQMDLMTTRVAGRIARMLAEEEAMSVSDLARLASSAATLRRAVAQAERDRADREGAARSQQPPSTESIRQAVREVYGVAQSQDRD